MLRFIAAGLFILLSLPASAERLVFIVGNAAYTELPRLENTLSDAKAYQTTFAQLGYTTFYHQDLSLDEMYEAFEEFLVRIKPGDEVAFVYSGHGWSDGAVNYLVPIDAPRGGGDLVLKRRSFALRNGLNGVLDEIEHAEAGFALAIVDACRNNPFEQPKGRKSVRLTRGLSVVKAAQGTFVVFSAGEGQEALDRLPNDPPEQELSVFSRTFIPRLLQGQYLEDAIAQTQLETAKLALQVDGHLQHPAYYDQTLGKTCLSDVCSPDSGANVSNVVARPRVSSEPLGKIALHEARSDNTCAAFRAVARDYRGTDYAVLANYEGASVCALEYPYCDTSNIRELRDIEVSPLTSNGLKLLQQRLNSLGCSVGGADGVWGQGSKRGLLEYSKEAGLKIDIETPDCAVLKEVHARPLSQFCPVSCKVYEQLVSGSCIRKSCPSGQTLSRSDGSCYTKKAAIPKKASNYEPPQGGANCFVFNGATHCD